MSLSIGTILGMVFVAVGGTTNVVLSLFVLSAANGMLLFQSIFRALPLLQPGSHTDASIYANYIGWDPMVIGTTWFIIEVAIYVVTAIIAVKIVSGREK